MIVPSSLAERALRNARSELVNSSTELKGSRLNPNEFVDFAIDDGLSEGEINHDFRNDSLMKDLVTGETRIDASRNKMGEIRKI